MQDSTLANVTLKSLFLLQWISIGVLAFALVQLIRKRIAWQFSSLLSWILIPAAMLISCLLYQQQHLPTLLEHRLSQRWTWKSGREEHTLTINVAKRTFTHSVQPINESENQGESPLPVANNVTAGNTSAFKHQIDVTTKEEYYSLYLFDFPQQGYTAMISIDGPSAPKLYLDNQQVVELR